MSLTPYAAALKNLLRVPSSPRLGLERMLTLLEELGRPQESLTFFHIAGTNGKGSTAAFLTQLLQTAGFKVGLTTSPHLQTARERIQNNGQKVSEERFVILEDRVAMASRLSDPHLF